MGQCAAARVLSVFLCILIFSHALLAAAYSCCTVWENLHLTLGLEKQPANLIHLNLKRGGFFFFFPPAVLHAASVSLIFFTPSTTNTEVPWGGRGASFSGKGKVTFCFYNDLITFKGKRLVWLDRKLFLYFLLLFTSMYSESMMWNPLREQKQCPRMCLTASWVVFN